MEEIIKLLESKIDDKDVVLMIGQYLANNGFKVMKSKFIPEKIIIIGTGKSEFGYIKKPKINL